MTTPATNLGVWERYTPDPWPEGIPTSVLFAKRHSDGVDWYTYSGNPQPANTVLAVASQENGYWTIKNATREYSKLWPDGMLLLSFVDDTQDDVLAKYAGMVWSGGNVIPKPVLKADLTAYAKSAAYEKETGGFTFNGHVIASDDRSKSLLLGSFTAAQANPAWTDTWSEADGDYNLDAGAITAMFNAMTAFVSRCFAKRREVLASITTGAITTTAQIDEAFASVQ